MISALQDLDTPLDKLESLSQQIGLEGSPADVKALRDQLQALRDKRDRLKQRAQKEAAQLQTILDARQAFDTSLGDSLERLLQRNSELDSHPLLQLDVESADTALDRHYDDQHGLMAMIQMLQEQIDEQTQKFEAEQEPVPQEFTDRVQEFNRCKDSILVCGLD